MARLLITSPAICCSHQQEIPLNAGSNIFYLTGRSDSPVCNDANSQSSVYGYIHRHHDKEFILYICEAIWINGNKSTSTRHLLRDGDQLTVNSDCQMTFRLDL